MKVIPYEHRGKIVREKELISTEDILEMQCLFLSETDKWLKKLIAIKLLEHGDLTNFNLDINELLNATKCQIEL